MVRVVLGAYAGVGRIMASRQRNSGETYARIKAVDSMRAEQRQYNPIVNSEPQLKGSPMANLINPSSHVVSLGAKAPHYLGDSGFISQVDASDLPMMRRLSIRRLLLERNGLRAPHWHANAHELGYCLSGQVLVTIAGNHAERESFEVGAGDMFFIPSGAMHSIANLAPVLSELILAFSHEKPEDFEMKSAYGAMSDAVLGNTYSLNASELTWFDRSTPDPKVVSIDALIDWSKEPDSAVWLGMSWAEADGLLWFVLPLPRGRFLNGASAFGCLCPRAERPR